MIISTNHQKVAEQRQRYALRKYTVGVVSVLVGALLLGGTAKQTHAATVETTATSVQVDQQQVEQQTTTPSSSTPAVSAQSTTPANKQQAKQAQFNVDDWGYSSSSDGITLTNYRGQGTDYYLPNAAAFRRAGKVGTDQQVFITPYLMRDLVRGTNGNGPATSIMIEHPTTSADQLVATDSLWMDAFAHSQRLQRVDLAGLNVSRIRYMDFLFANDPALKTVDGLENWDVSSLRYAYSLFLNDTNLVGSSTGELDLSRWRTDNLFDCDRMFYRSGVRRVNISNWHLDHGHGYTYEMFAQLVHPATIIMNNFTGGDELRARDFAGDQPLVVISNMDNLLEMNQQSDGHGGQGHPANLVTFVKTSDQQPLGQQQQPFVYRDEQALHDRLTEIPQYDNVASVIPDQLTQVVNDQDATWINGNSYSGVYGKLAGTYAVANQQSGRIIYVDPDGQQVATEPINGGQPVTIGETVAINPVAPAGWELVDNYPQWYTATASGDQDVIVTVKRIVTEPEEPGTKPEKPGINPGTPGNGQVTGTVNNRPATTASQPKAKLPQTGNGQETLVTASGLAVLSLLGLAGLKKKHD